MLTVEQILFAVAALIGLTLAVMHIKKKNVPIMYALPHGIFAATGLYGTAVRKKSSPL